MTVKGEPFSVATMQRARDLHGNGWRRCEIRRIIEQETGRKPADDTVRRWVDDQYREHKNGQVARSQRTAAAHTFSVSYRGPEWLLARMKALYAAGVSCRSVAVVMAIDFPTLPTLTEHEVRYAIDLDRLPRTWRRHCNETTEAAA